MNKNVKKMVGIAVLMALVVVMQFITSAIPPIGGFSISLVLIPIVIGATLFGPEAGAILGAKLGQEALPEFYLECLEPAEILMELADDLHQGCPMEQGDLFYDTDWDRKYIHGGT